MISRILGGEPGWSGDKSEVAYGMTDHGSRARFARPGEFVRWFLDREMQASAGMGLATDRARLHLGRAVAFLEQGMLREALAEANSAAYLDGAVRPEALLVARMCVLRELADGPSG
ncbi:hypothetical protein SOCE26_078630 [Sorangium cellulosum]|uniref:Uncharacterized protein n=1 Tax=Sorangium cellulosum TaxID=56 RepID=A0A2L0F4A1_SORCE|nr:hypothetical protein [Sorangium cellulosum]AUX46357.1 hypothetical protein SOCE26_078630 [Sorangium cellulosum]